MKTSIAAVVFVVGLTLLALGFVSSVRGYTGWRAGGFAARVVVSSNKGDNRVVATSTAGAELAKGAMLVPLGVGLAILGKWLYGDD